MIRRWPTWAMALVLVGAVLETQAAVVNGGFDSNLSGWSPVTGNPAISATWVAEDHHGSPGSGSAELRDATPGSGGVQVVLSQCINLAGSSVPTPFTVSAKVTLEGEPSVKGWLFINEHNAAGCPPGSYTGASRGELVNDSTASWQSFSDGFTPFNNATVSVNLMLSVEKPVGTGSGGAVRFDQIQFGSSAARLSRWTIDSGGGHLSAGNWTLQGSVGQPDPGSTSGGGISLQSGFWFADSAAVDDSIFKDGFEVP